MTSHRSYPWMAALLAVAFVGAGCAAERIRYEDLRKRLGRPGTLLTDRGFTVTTLDGRRYRSRSLVLDSGHVFIERNGRTENLPSTQIARIEISQRGRFRQYMLIGLAIPVVGATLACPGLSDGCLCPVGIALAPAGAAAAAAVAPFCLVADGVALLIPPKVYEIVQ